MSELLFLKLGGSLITDKRQEATARPDIIRCLAQEVKAALTARADLQLLIGHGSGSFGHVQALRYHVHQGCSDWWGYAATGAAAARLNRLVTDTFLDEGVPVISLQPSASAYCRDGELVEMAVQPILSALAHGLLPLVYGDVAFDATKGSTIVSTEQVFSYLARRLGPERIVLAGEVEGVFTGDPQSDDRARLIPEISRQNIEEIRDKLSGSYAVDVTGGMLGKVLAMWELICEYPALMVRITSGLRPGCLQQALLDAAFPTGTWLHW